MTASQRSSFTKRRKEIWEALYPAAKAEIQVARIAPPELSTGYKQPPPQEKAFAAATAAITGESKSQIIWSDF